MPLNYDQITNAIYQVFSALGIKDCNDNIDFLAKTPANAVSTPTAPVVSKIIRNGDFRFVSLNITSSLFREYLLFLITL